MYLSLHAYLELESPTPSVYRHQTRAALRVAHHAANWEGDIARTAKFLAEAVKRVEEQVMELGGWAEVVGGPAKQGWREGLKGYVAAVERLAECEEKLGYSKNAAGRWRALLKLGGEEGGLGGVVDRKVRSRAAVKLGALLDEVAGVELDEKEGDLAAPLTREEKGEKKEEESDEAATRRTEQAAREAEGLFTLAYILAYEDAGLPTLPATERPGIIPASVPVENLTPELLYTATELGIHNARLKQLDLALPIFLSILRARTKTSLPPRESVDLDYAAGDLADPCEVGKIQSYLGEVLWTAGQKGQGLEWSMRAVDATEPLVEQRAACRDCAVFAGGNVVMMLRRLLEEVDENKSKKKEGRGLYLWRRPEGDVGDGKGGSVEEWERQLEVAEERLKRVLGVRVAKGK